MRNTCGVDEASPKHEGVRDPFDLYVTVGAFARESAGAVNPSRLRHSRLSSGMLLVATTIQFRHKYIPSIIDQKRRENVRD
jgi:hypothetical protein